jgi:hypothetical protein
MITWTKLWSLTVAGVAAMALTLLARPVAHAADPARTVGFVAGSIVVIRAACGVDDDPDGLGRLLVHAGVAKADIAPGGRRRAAFEAGADEARASLSARLRRDGRQAFCGFALQRYGREGLGVVRG